MHDENDDADESDERSAAAGTQPASLRDEADLAWASSMPLSNTRNWSNALTPWKTWAMFWNFSKRRSPGPIKYFDALPTCAEAVEAALLMHRILADYSSSFALLVAGVDFDDIPYVDVIYRNESLLTDWMREFTQ